MLGDSAFLVARLSRVYRAKQNNGGSYRNGFRG